MINLLIVEDEPQLVGILEYLLKNEGYNILKAYDGEEALKLIKINKPDLVLLDIMIPKIDGFQICNYIKKNTNIPVIILSAKKEDEDKIIGLELGAEDYITKPFNHKELVLRIKNIIKQHQYPNDKKAINLGKIKIDPASREVFIDNNKIELTPLEFNLLYYIAKNANKVLTWESIFSEIWGFKDWEGSKEVVKINIYRLRRKIEKDPSNPEYLITIRGIGYKLVSHNN